MGFFEEVARLAAQRATFVIATVVETGGSSPRKAGARLVVLADGTPRGTIGGGAIEHEVLREARELLASAEEQTRLYQAHLGHDLGMCCGGKMGVFLEKVSPPERLLIFGAGHVGQALEQFARAVGFAVTVLDARPEQLNEERFPKAERLLGDPVEAARALPTDDRTWVSVMTHDHALDQEIILALLPRPWRYLGLIGSQRKALKCRERLHAEGCAAELVARLRSPMGLPIGGESPEEIALSICAELVSVRYGVTPSGPAKLG